MIDTKTKNYTISRWHAEFEDLAIERAYRQHIEIDVARSLTRALIIWALLILAFGWPDWVALGPGPGFTTLFVLRFGFASLLLGLAYVIRRKTIWATAGWPVTVVAIAGYPLFFIYPYILPSDGVFGLAIMMMMLLSVYVFVPNRLKLTNLVAAVGIAMVLVNILFAGATVTDVIMVSMALLWPVIIGYAAAHRMNTDSRKAFSALLAAEDANRALAEEITQRKALEIELQHQALTDPLTGLSNRRQYELLFYRELGKHKRYGTPLVLGMIDLDHFKRINDEHGHEFGDQVLKTVGEALREPLRSSDILGRFGGEEFILILPETNIEQASAIAERMRQALCSMAIVKDGETFRITATFAITEVCDTDQKISDIIRRADEALYQGKHAGRDRVMKTAAA